MTWMQRWWGLAWLASGAMSAALGQTDGPSLGEALDFPTGRFTNRGYAWKASTTETHDGVDAVAGHREWSSDPRLRFYSRQGGTARFWCKVSGRLTVTASGLEQLSWYNEEIDWEQHEVFLTPNQSRSFDGFMQSGVDWRLSVRTSKAWIDELELIPAVSAEEAFDTDTPFALEGDWAGYVSEQSSDREDHLRLFKEGNFETTLLGPGVASFQVQSGTDSDQVVISVDQQRLGRLHRLSGKWELVKLQIPEGLHQLRIENLIDQTMALDAFVWEPGETMPVLATVINNTVLGRVGGTVATVVNHAPGLTGRANAIRIGPTSDTLPDGEDSESEVLTTVQGPGRLGFWWRLQQGDPLTNALRFRVDGQERAKLTTGTSDWVYVSTTLTPGEHLVSFYYEDFSRQSTNMAWLGRLQMIASPRVSFAEAMETPGQHWWTSGSQDWVGYASLEASDGQDAAGSGTVGTGRSSWIATEVTGPGVLRTRWRCAGIPGSSTLVFEDNGQPRAVLNADGQWHDLVAEIPPGAHVLRWLYQSISADTVSQASHAGWLDAVTFSPGTLPLQAALSSDIALTHSGHWSILSDGNGASNVHTSTPGAWLQFGLLGAGTLTGEARTPQNALQVYQGDTSILTLPPHSSWLNFSHPVGEDSPSIFRIERDAVDNGQQVQLRSLTYVGDAYLNELGAAVGLSGTVTIARANPDHWSVPTPGNHGIVGLGSGEEAQLTLSVRGPGLLRLVARVMNASQGTDDPPEISVFPSNPWATTLEVESDGRQELYYPILQTHEMLLSGGSDGVVLDTLELIPAQLRQTVDDGALHFETGGDEPFYTLKSHESPDGETYFLCKDLSNEGLGWLDTEIVGPAVLAFHSYGDVSLRVNQEIGSRPGAGYHEIPLSAGSHKVRFTSRGGALKGVKRLTESTIATAIDLDISQVRYVYVSGHSKVLPPEDSFDGEDALYLPYPGFVEIGVKATGFFGYFIKESNGWLPYQREIEPQHSKTIVLRGQGIDRVVFRDLLPLTEWPVSLTTSESNPWMVAPFPGAPNDDVSLRSPDGESWIEIPVQGPAELRWSENGVVTATVDGEEATTVSSISQYRWRRQRLLLGQGPHTVRLASTRSLLVDDIEVVPGNEIAEALDLEFPYGSIEANGVLTSSDQGLDGDDALKLSGRLLLQFPYAGIASLWQRKEGEAWRKELYFSSPNATGNGSSLQIDVDGEFVDRLEYLPEVTFQEALDTDLPIWSGYQSRAIPAFESTQGRDYVAGYFSVTAPEEGNFVYQKYVGDRWLWGNLSGVSYLSLGSSNASAITKIDAVGFSTDASPIMEAVDGVLSEGLETFGWAPQTEVWRTGGSALVSSYESSTFKVPIPGPGILTFWTKSEGEASVSPGYAEDQLRTLEADGWTRVDFHVSEPWRTAVWLEVAVDHNFQLPWKVWVDDLSFTPAVDVAALEALDTDIPISFTNPDHWRGHRDTRAIGGDLLRFEGPESSTEEGLQFEVTGPGVATFHFTYSYSTSLEVLVGGERPRTLNWSPGKGEVSVPEGTHQVSITLRKDSRYGDLEADLDHLSFHPNQTLWLEPLIQGPVAVSHRSWNGSPNVVEGSSLFLNNGNLTFHVDQPGLLQFDFNGRFGFGLTTDYYKNTIQHPDWSTFQYVAKAGESLVVDPFYRFDFSSSIDPNTRPVLRGIRFKPTLSVLPSLEVALGNHVSDMVPIEGEWSSKTFGEAEAPTMFVHGKAQAGGQAATLGSAVSGPGLLQFRFRLKKAYRTSLKLMIDGDERWESFRSDDWVQAVTHLGPGDHQIQWVVSNPNSNVTSEVWIDDIQVLQHPGNFFEPFGLSESDPAVFWRKTLAGEPLQVGPTIGPMDSGLSLRVPQMQYVSFEHRGSVRDDAAWSVNYGSRQQTWALQDDWEQGRIVVPPGGSQVDWKLQRTRPADEGDIAQLQSISVQPLQMFTSSGPLSILPTPLGAWQTPPSPSVDETQALAYLHGNDSAMLATVLEGSGTLRFQWSHSSTRNRNSFVCTINGESIAGLHYAFERRDGLTFDVLHDLPVGTHHVQWLASAPDPLTEPVQFTLDNVVFEPGARPLVDPILNLPAMRTHMGSAGGWKPSTDEENAVPSWESSGPGFVLLNVDFPSRGTLEGQSRLYDAPLTEERTVIVHTPLEPRPSETLTMYTNDQQRFNPNYYFDRDGYSSWNTYASTVEPGPVQLRWNYKSGNPDKNKAVLQGWTFTPLQPTSLDEIAEAVDYDGPLSVKGSLPWIVVQNSDLQGGDALALALSSSMKTGAVETRVTGPGEIGFRWRTSGFGEFTLVLDGEPTLSHENLYYNQGWSTVSRTIPAGPHVVSWVFTGESDTAFRHLNVLPAQIDQITFRRTNHIHEALDLAPEMLVTTVQSGSPPIPAWDIKAGMTPTDNSAVVSEIGSTELRIDVPLPHDEITLSITGIGRAEGDQYPGERARAFPEWKTITLKPNATTRQVRLLPSSGLFAVARFTKPLSYDVALDTRLAITDDGQQSWSVADADNAGGGVHSIRAGLFRTSVYGPGEVRFRWRNAAAQRVQLLLNGHSTKHLFLCPEWQEESIPIPPGRHQLTWVSGGPGAQIDYLRFLPEGAQETFQQWTASHELQANPSADPNNDAISNLLAYAFNLDPLSSEAYRTGSGVSGSLPEHRIVTEVVGDKLQLTYLRRHDSGLRYVPRFSSDMETWSTVISSMTITDLADGWEQVTVIDSVPIPESGRRFGIVEVLQ